jgi:hypothetical protein
LGPKTDEAEFSKATFFELLKNGKIGLHSSIEEPALMLLSIGVGACEP